MKRLLHRFREEDEGAITVDWVVLTAAVIGLGVASIAIIAQSAKPNADNLGNFLSDRKTGL